MRYEAAVTVPSKFAKTSFTREQDAAETKQSDGGGGTVPSLQHVYVQVIST